MDTAHVAANRNVGGELVELTLEGEELVVAGVTEGRAVLRGVLDGPVGLDAFLLVLGPIGREEIDLLALVVLTTDEDRVRVEEGLEDRDAGAGDRGVAGPVSGVHRGAFLEGHRQER